MTGDLRKAFSYSNMKLALLRLQRNQGHYYKNHFRHIYRAYAISPDDSLKELAKRLRNDAHNCHHTTKCYLPKASLIQRPMSLMAVEDQIAYQAMGNIIGDALYPVMRPNYYNTVFGNLYYGPQNPFCYRDWRLSHRAFNRRILEFFNRGYIWTATFDLTACYDSIDHGVLMHFLRDLGLDDEFRNRLGSYLRIWTVSCPASPIIQGHGIPQGPMTSGILSECVLRHFDKCAAATANNVRYMRYVDDIRLMALSEESLREQVVELDMCSKDIGLFPQSSKIRIHCVEDIYKEIKTISAPELPLTHNYRNNDAAEAERAIALLSQNKVILPGDETAFRYWLPALPKRANHALRLLDLLEKYPHMVSDISAWLGGFPRLSLRVSEKCLLAVRGQSMYGGFVAAIIRMLSTNIYPDCWSELIKLCEELSETSTYVRDPAMREAVKGVLVNTPGITWKLRRLLLLGDSDWWVRSRVFADINPTTINRKGAYEKLINHLLLDKDCDVAIVAAEAMGTHGFPVKVKRSRIRSNTAQYVLRQQGLIGKIRNNRCMVSEATEQVLGHSVSIIDWRLLLASDYRRFSLKIMRWKSYASTDPTAWVNYTDTLNDLLLSALRRVEINLSNYTQGHIGGYIYKVNKGKDTGFSTFAQTCGRFHQFVVDIHELRKVSDLSHPVQWSTGRSSRAISHKEMRNYFPKMVLAYTELWAHIETLL